MKYAFLALAVAVVLAIGFLVMKKTDTALESNERKIREISRNSSLRVAFESPDTVQEMIPLFERLSEKYPECEIYLFTATPDEIRDSLTNHQADIGFLTTVDISDGYENLNTYVFRAEKGSLLCPVCRLPIEPLNLGKASCTAIWNKNNASIYVHALSELLASSFNNKE